MKDKPIIFVISVVTFVICTTTVQASDFNILFEIGNLLLFCSCCCCEDYNTRKTKTKCNLRYFVLLRADRRLNVKDSCYI